MGLHFLAFWPCGPSFPCILALWAFISFHFGVFGVSFWGPPPQVAKKGPFAQRPYSAVTGSILQFLAFWAFISLHFGLVGLHFLALWPCRPSFPCILALWAFISLHFGLVGLHFLSFWPFRGQLLGPPPPQVAKNGPFAQRPYNGFISAVTGSILQFLAFWAFISLHFWPCGPSFPCILALWAFIPFHFGLVGLHFLAFWFCGPSFPCILVLWAFISLHFGLVGLHFLSFWVFRGQLLGPPHKLPKMARLPNVRTMDLSTPWPAPFCSFSHSGPSFPCILALWAFTSFHFGLFGVSFWGWSPTSCQKWPVCPTSVQWIYQRRDRLHFAVFSLLGLHVLAFWHCGPSFPCILVLWAFISFHFGFFGVSFWAPPTSCQKCNGFINAVAGSILQFFAFWAFISLHFGLVGLHFLAFWPCGPSFPCILAL